MAATPNPYTKLPGRGLRKTIMAVSATRCRLWLAADHLLAIDATLASEEYRRFYFRDIEAFIVRRTGKRQMWNWFFLVLALLSAGPFFAAWQQEGEGGYLIAAMAFAAVWGTFLLINTLRGATCETHVRTAVQLEHLPSLGRLPIARRVLERIRPAIEAAQGGVTPEELAAAPWIAPEHAPGAAVLPQPVQRDNGRMHLLLAGTLLGEAITGGAYYAWPHNALGTASMLLTFLGFFFCIMAFVRQRDHIVAPGLRLFGKLAFGYYILGFLAGMVFTVSYVVRNPETPIVTGLEIVGEPGFAVTTLVGSILAAMLALYGFAQVFANAREKSAPSA